MSGPSCRLTLVVDDDWYTIERASHSNTYGLAATGDPGLFAGTYSGRISDADVEGTAGEMRDIARAIRERGETEHRRCAVRVEGDRVHFWSPRNSQRAGVVSLADADELAAEIESRLCEVAT